MPVEEAPSTTPDDIKFQDSVVVVTTNADKIVSSAQAKGVEVVSEVPAVSNKTYVTLEGSVSDPEIKQLERQQDNVIVGNIVPTRHYKAELTSNDTYISSQWNLSKISAPAAWNVTTGNENVTVAVLDTGVLFSQQWGSSGPFTHPDFPADKQWTNTGELGTTVTEGSAPNCTSRGLALDKSCNNVDDDGNGFLDDYKGWDFMGGWRGSGSVCPNYADSTFYADPVYTDFIAQDNDPSPYSCDDSSDPDQLNKDHYAGGCDYGEGACAISHGTSVASIASAASNNSSGVASVDWGANVMNLRVLDGYGYGSSVQIAAAIDYATDNGADVINMSLALQGPSGCTMTDPTIENAMVRAKAAGVVVVAAAGNNGGSGVCYPARSPNAIAVGASTSSDSRASFSTYGAELDVLAPGSAVPVANAPSAYRAGTYNPSVYGTSFAAPHVAGLVALMKARSPAATPAQLQSILIHSADKTSAMNGYYFTNYHGYGRINAARAVQLNSVRPGTTLAKSATLLKSKMLLSSGNGKYRLVLQTDGNLVLYSGNKAVWHSRTYGKGSSRLVLQSDGNLVLYRSDGRALWHTRTNGKPANRLVLQSDGNLVLYTATNKALWNTRTQGK